MPDRDPVDAPVRVAIAQFEPRIGALDENRAAMERLVREAAAQNAAVVVLPELSDSGYMFDDAAELARLAGPVPGGGTASLLAALARELGLYIAAGVAERDGARFYNTAALFGPDGYVGKYRKLHLWDQENRFFAKGDVGLPVFDTPFGKLGLAICYDGWFPETFRSLAVAGAALVCVPTNWVPMPGAAHDLEPMANVLVRAAAHCNGLYIASADRVGTERGQSFIGRSLIVGPEGQPLAGPASGDAEEVLTALLDLSACAQRRAITSFNNLLDDRRSDVY